MARSRMIRPEFWDDERLAKVSRDTRYTFIGLWKCSDDFGVCRGNASWLKSQIFPYDDTLKLHEFEGWIDALIKFGFITPFTHGDEKYLFIHNFLKYQKVDKPSKTRNPKPPENIDKLRLATLSRVSREDSEIFADETEVKQKLETESIYYVGQARRCASDLKNQAKEILEFLNEKAQKNFKPVDANLKPIMARIKESSMKDCRQIIAKKVREWSNDPKMAPYLRPATLFNATKFAQYQGELLKQEEPDESTQTMPGVQ